jgi:hypothetical protein
MITNNVSGEKIIAIERFYLPHVISENDCTVHMFSSSQSLSH